MGIGMSLLDPQAEEKVFPYGQMGEKGQILRHIGNPPPLRGQGLNFFPSDEDCSFLELAQAHDGFQDERFPASRGSQ